jgi:hypothetical protein
VKFQKLVRMPMMLAVVGTGLLIARPASAQQDLDPTHFDDSQGTVRFNQPVDLTSNAAVANLSAENAPVTLKVEETGNTPVDASALLMLLGTGAIALIGTAKAMEGRRRRREGVGGSAASI